MAEDLQGAADILFYSIANKGNQEAMNILNDAISKAEGKNKDLLKNISAERIAVELKKLVCGKNAFNILLFISNHLLFTN